MVPGVIDRTVLALTIRKIFQFIDDLRPMRSCTLAVRANIVHADYDGVGNFTFAWSPALIAHIRHNYCAITNLHLRSMILANLHALLEPKSRAEPRNRLPYIGINQRGNYRRSRDRTVRFHHAISLMNCSARIKQ